MQKNFHKENREGFCNIPLGFPVSLSRSFLLAHQIWRDVYFGQLLLAKAALATLEILYAVPGKQQYLIVQASMLGLTKTKQLTE